MHHYITGRLHNLEDYTPSNAIILTFLFAKLLLSANHQMGSLVKYGDRETVVEIVMLFILLRYFGTFYTRRTMVRSRETDCERLKSLHLYDDEFLHKYGGFPKWLSINLDFSLSVRLRLFPVTRKKKR